MKEFIESQMWMSRVTLMTPNALQCVAVCCSVLHCVAVCCSMRDMCQSSYTHGIATISRFLNIIGLVCRIWSLL